MSIESRIGIMALSKDAALILQASLGLSATIWGYRLANWRKPDRMSAIPWSINHVGNPVYDVGDLQAFIDKELSAKSALEKSRTNTVVAGCTTTLMKDWSGDPDIRVSFLVRGSHQSVYALGAEQALILGQKLIQCANGLKRWTVGVAPSEDWPVAQLCEGEISDHGAGPYDASEVAA